MKESQTKFKENIEIKSTNKETDEEDAKKVDKDFFLFRNSSISRPTRFIMREPFPTLKPDGSTKRMIPGMKAQDKLFQSSSKAFEGIEFTLDQK